MEVQRDILIACSVGDLEWLEKSIARTVKSITGMIDHEVRLSDIRQWNTSLLCIVLLVSRRD